MGERDSEVLRGHDERNVASLIFVPTQERLPKAMLHLERIVLQANGQPAKIVCVGVPGIGLARGMDNDILVALINTYIDAGCPEDGFITVTAYTLLKLAGLATSSRYYQSLDQGLQRMLNTTYNITDGWFDAKEKRYTTVSFRIIDNLEHTHTDEGLDRRSVLKIRLNDKITKSINQGHIKPLDLSVYQHLPTVGTRALYRLLDVYLDEAVRRGEAQPYRLALPLMTLADNCGLLERRPGHLKEALENMHGPLLEIGYLKSVGVVGRGRATMVHYVYGEASSPVNPEHVTLLLQRGVHRGVAEKYVRQLGQDVLLVVEKFDERKRRGEKIHSEGAYLAKLLQEAASIVEEVKRQTAHVQEVQRHKKTTTEAHSKAVQAQDLLFDLQQDALVQVAEPAAALALVLPPFKLKQLERRGLTLPEIDQLQQLVLGGSTGVLELQNAVTKALMGQNLTELRALLRG
ncbi:replication initiator protein A [Deinococcus oregonensis]|uniref:Replication initiator protein A n=1 Tax=Deinococcus oregonensis TaxID=1805970 RepID=A0ABV6AV64_9DEIO